MMDTASYLFRSQLQ